MKYLVTGVNGQLGYDVVRELKSRDIRDEDIIAFGRHEMDITDEESVHQIITEVRPDVVFHNAAYTKVDLAEENRTECYQVNSLGTKYIAEACKEIGAKLIYVSTDYVFDGKKDGIYNEADQPNPQSVYGTTKYIGEAFARCNPKTYIVRVSWVFGIHGGNFVKTMLKLAESKESVSVVNDQFGSPTYTIDLARLLVDMSEEEKYGIYHATNEGFCSWSEFAQYILKGTNTQVHPVSTEEYYKPQYEKAEIERRKLTIAIRPECSKLSKVRLKLNGFKSLPKWEDAVDRFMEELEREKVYKK